MRVRKPFLSALFVLAALHLSAAAGIDSSVYLEDVRSLASERLQGRATGTPGLEKAAEYIARQFRSMGLRPPAGNDYYQAFRVTSDARLGKANRLEFSEGAKRTSLTVDQWYRPMPFSANGRASGELVFAGYGITAPEYGYDDYAGIDARGRIVLVLRHEPQEFDEKSVFAGRVYTNHSMTDVKTANAAVHGALAVIFVNDMPTHPVDSDVMERLLQTIGPARSRILVMQVQTSVANQWLRPAGHSIEELVLDIDKDLKPRSFQVPATLRLDLEVSLRERQREVHNVLAYLPGETDELIVVGAHYDHIGLGYQFSMDSTKRGSVHPGADDNASGTAGVIELARYFARQPKQRRGILFVTFAGEEYGLLGSSFYVNHPPLPLAKTVAMINMDMIGRMRDNKLYVGGMHSGTGFQELVEDLNRAAGFDLADADAGGYGSSDQFSFLPKKIPVLFFFSGLHPDYHTPGDTWDKIDAPDAARLLDFVAGIIQRLTDAPSRPEFVRR